VAVSIVKLLSSVFMIFTSYYELVFTQLLTKHLEENFIASDHFLVMDFMVGFFKQTPYLYAILCNKRHKYCKDLDSTGWFQYQFEF